MKRRWHILVILLVASATWLGGCSARGDAISVAPDDPQPILAKPGGEGGMVSQALGRERDVSMEFDRPDDGVDFDKLFADFAEMLEQHENRKKYTSFDQKTLESIEDGDLEQAILDYIAYKVNGDWENEHATVTGLSKGFVAIYTTSWVEAEVNNGGFNQYFWNSSGQFALEAIEGFRAIGAPAYADLMSRAVAIAIKEFPKMRKYYELDTIEAFAESYQHTDLEGLDTEFYELGDGLSDLRIKYIRSHPHLFYVDN